MIIALTLILLPFILLGLMEILKQKSKPVLKEKSPNSAELRSKVYQAIIKMIHSGKLVLPNGYIFSNGHIWLKVMPQGEVQLGIDDFLLKLLGKIDKIELNHAGEKVNKDGKMCVIHLANKILSIPSPLEGTIIETNREITGNCEIIYKSPYEAGWLYRVRPSLEFRNTKNNSYIADSAIDWLQKEMEKLSNYVVREYPSRSELEILLREGEAPLEGILQNMDERSWIKFEENFLR